MRALWVLLASVLVPGCLLVDPPSGHMGGPTIPAGAFCLRLAEVVCRGYVTCCTAHTADESACVSSLSGRCEQTLGPVLRNPATGYSETIATLVVAEGHTYAAACDPGIIAWYSSRTGLARVFEGTVASGEMCTHDAAGYFSCTDLTQSCTGGPVAFCHARTATGMPCRADAECIERDYCAGAVAGSNPLPGMPGRCQPKEDDGSPCTIGAACRSLLCDTAGTHTCAMLSQTTAYCGLR